MSYKKLLYIHSIMNTSLKGCNEMNEKREKRVEVIEYDVVSHYKIDDYLTVMKTRSKEEELKI
ncbi:MAG: hypothetical protein ACXAEU_01720 [Candidatus Hodarchaeales archaeon]